MKLKNILNFAAFFCALTLNAHGTIAISELPPKFDLKKAIDGVYSNTLQDKITVRVAEEDVDLFGPQFYSVIIDVSLAQGNVSIELDENDFQKIDNKGTIRFFETVDCQDPGCQVYELTIEFKLKKDGTYTVLVDYDGSHEVNESVGFDSESRYRNGDVELEDVESVCQDLFSVIDRNTYASLDNSGAWCYYTRKSYLSRR